MRRSQWSRLFAALVGAVFLAAGLAACGDDDGPGVGAMGEEEFCDRLEEFAELEDQDVDDEEALAEFRTLGRQAPNPEVRGALEQFAEVAERMAEFDEDDPEAFGEVMALMFDPEFMAAAETLDAYATDVCGMDPIMGTDFDDDFEFELDDDGEG